MHTRAPRTNLGAALVLIVAALGLAWAPASRCTPEPDPGSAPGAAKSIAVLDFELHDLTPLPPTAEELQRTASLRLLVQQTLQARGAFQLVPINPTAQAQANVGFGYLYDHPEAAAALGRAQGADWILVGRLHKPSFLFAYLMARLVDTHTEKVLKDLVVEAKGQSELVTARGATRLAEQVQQVLDLY